MFAKPEAPSAIREGVLAKAALRSAAHMKLSSGELADILGVSEASISRMHRGSFHLADGSKAFELGQLFVRVFRGLDAITGSDDAASASWIRGANRNFQHRAPLDLMKTVRGLVEVADYVDSRRARV